MKSITAILCILTFGPWALAAPVATVNKLPSQSDDASTHVRQTAKPTEVVPQVKTKFIFFSFFAPSRVSIDKHTKLVVAEDGRRIQLPDNLAGAKSWETPHVLNFLTKLTRPKKLSPFPESSIMREETRANMAEIEPEETIVELETKAERESWTYLPYVSQDRVLRFYCVRKAADTVMLALPVAATAMILITIFSSALRYAFRTVGIAKDGAICLQDDEESAISGHSLRVACDTQALRLDVKADSSNHGTIDEKS
ncbi:hypothetical protein F4804DRAFT_17517 [Jackrogersella minutella]|nr:hypothetical protein F4804DRAFT_17517 [Jackrogersella minutella]